MNLLPLYHKPRAIYVIQKSTSELPFLFRVVNLLLFKGRSFGHRVCQGYRHRDFGVFPEQDVLIMQNVA